ncbi:exonuclease domain-containing protein [Trueperella bialowiezensis]
MRHRNGQRPGARLDLTPSRPHREGTAAPQEEQLALDSLGPNLFDVTFLVLDLETTGGPPGLNAITEFGAVKVRGGEVFDEFTTLVNPGGGGGG